MGLLRFIRKYENIISNGKYVDLWTLIHFNSGRIICKQINKNMQIENPYTQMFFVTFLSLLYEIFESSPTGSKLWSFYI